MRLLIDTSSKSFQVSKAPEQKKDQDGRQRANRDGELLYTVQAFALDEDGSGGAVITITVAGAMPKVSVGQKVNVSELEAIPWAQNGRNGVAYRAKSVTAVSTPSASKAAA